MQASQLYLKAIGCYGNFLRKPIQVGDLYEFDDSSFLLLTHFAEATQSIQTSAPADLVYTRQSGSDVQINASVNSGAAAGSASLTFNESNSSFISLKNTVTNSIEAMTLKDKVEGHIKTNNLDAHRRKIILITETIVAASGVMMFSSAKNNQVTLSASNHKPIAALSEIGNGNIEVTKTTSDLLQVISNTSFVALFIAHWLKPNGLFEKLG